MIVVTGGRRSGKTSAVIRWLLEDPQYRAVAVLNHERRQHLRAMLREVVPHINPTNFRILTVQELYGFMVAPNQQRGDIHEIAIDDAEEVLKQLFGARVGFMAMTATWIPLGAVEPDRVRAEVVTDHQIDDRPFFDRPPGAYIERPTRKQRGRDVEIRFEGRTPPSADGS